ncbi:MAG: hypothetical protein JRM73_04525 [Nitrososphaerota archaeon]|nr:hypothetical protein [Nitrososphaerota archaeon]
MSSSGRYGDATAVLYIVPFLASGIYGLYLWVQAGLSAILPTSVYLTVTRDPYIFMVGSLAVLLGVFLDMSGTDPAQRKAKLTSIGSNLQSLAVASLILVLVCALYANGLNIGNAASDFIVGRYGLVFPAVLVLLSFLVTAQFNLSALAKPRIFGIVALLLATGSIYEIGKRQVTVGLAIALFLIIVGASAFLLPDRKKAEEKSKP